MLLPGRKAPCGGAVRAGRSAQGGTLKIALVHPKFDRTGGAERYAVALAEGLVERGHEVHLFGRRADAVVPGARFRSLRALPLGRALKTWSFDRAASRALAGEPFDVIQGFGKTTCQTVHRTGGGLHRAYLARTGHGAWSRYDRVAAGIEDRLFRSQKLHAVICPSRWVAAEVKAQYPSASARIRVIPNGVDTSAFRPEGRDADRSLLFSRLRISTTPAILLCAATNFRLKGLDTAVEMLAGLPGAHLVVAGGDDPGPFREQAGRLGVGDRIHFLGTVPDLAPLYRAADVLVHLTRYDPFANVCLEALACGTPVVTTERNGASDILTEALGAVVSAEDPDRARSEVQRLLGAGPTGREEARAIAVGNDHRRHVAQVEELYVSLQPREGV